MRDLIAQKWRERLERLCEITRESQLLSMALIGKALFVALPLPTADADAIIAALNGFDVQGRPYSTVILNSISVCEGMRFWGKTAGQTGGCRPVPGTGAVFTGEGAVVEFGTCGIPVVSHTHKYFGD